MKSFDYSLIRYAPDPKRGEIINIGLVVFKQDKIDVKTISSLSKLRLIDGRSEHEDLKNLEKTFLEITQDTYSPDEQYKLLNLFFRRGILLSGQAKFSVQNINEYDAKVEGLFKTLVEPLLPVRKIPQKRQRLTTTIKNEFEKLKAISYKPEDINNHKIIPNYLTPSGLKADFLARNGHFHLTEVADLNVENISTKMGDISLKIMTMIESKEPNAFDEDVECHFVYYADSAKKNEARHIINMAGRHSDHLYNLYLKSDSKKYFKKMEEVIAAGAPPSVL